MSEFRDANLRALRERFPDLALGVERARPSVRLTIERARSGHPVPCIERDGAPRPLHSRVDPLREGERFADTLAGAGYFVVLGLGGGYHLRSLLARFPAARVLLIERDVELFAALAAQIDLVSLFSDARVELLLDPDPRALERTLSSSYLPALHGALVVAPLRARIDGDSAFNELRRAIEAAIEGVARDFTVQARFGRLWFRNIVANLECAERATFEPPAVDRALVVGAGPSLDAQSQRLRDSRAGATLIATDAALPALLERALAPDVVVSIDAQALGYRHFVRGCPRSTQLALGFASPPTLARRARLFFAGGHPLERYVAARWRGVPLVDTSGGNVGHAALSFALGCGARHVTLFGFDYSYPRGKPYARGCHIYPTFALAASRVAPVEGATQALVFRPTHLERSPLEGGFRYHTETLEAYRSHFEAAFGRGLPDAIVIDQASGEGVKLELGRGGAGPAIAALEQAALERDGHRTRERSIGWRQLLEEYRDRVAGMELSSDGAIAAQLAEGRAPAELATLLPVAAALRAERPDRDVVAESRAWALRVIDRRLARRDDQLE